MVSKLQLSPINRTDYRNSADNHASSIQAAFTASAAAALGDKPLPPEFNQIMDALCAKAYADPAIKAKAEAYLAQLAKLKVYDDDNKYPPANRKQPSQELVSGLAKADALYHDLTSSFYQSVTSAVGKTGEGVQINADELAGILKANPFLLTNPKNNPNINSVLKNLKKAKNASSSVSQQAWGWLVKSGINTDLIISLNNSWGLMPVQPQ